MTSRDQTDRVPYAGSSHRRRRARRLVAGAALLLVGALPATAQAAPSSGGRGASAAAALGDYHAYLSSLADLAPASARGAGALVATVQRTCPRKLADLNGYSSEQLDASALSAFGDEVAGDLTLAYLTPAHPALLSFTDRLSGLSWSLPSDSATVSGLVRAERHMAALGAPHLCADAVTLDADPLGEPASTAGFLRRFRSGSGALHRSLTGFGMMLSQAVPADQSGLIATVNGQVSQYAAVSRGVEAADTSAILAALGVSSATQRRDTALRRR